MVYNNHNKNVIGGREAPFLIKKMDWVGIILLYSKYILAITMIVVIALAPSWIARQTKKDKQQMGWVRIYSWLFGWTGIGWLIGLYIAIRK